jgi:glutamate dehydrogenase
VETLAAVLEKSGRADALSVAKAFAERLPGSYFERTTPAAAAADLVEVERLAESPADTELMAVAADPDPAAGMFRLRLYGPRGVELSRVVPLLESFGLIVVEAVPHRVVSVLPGRPPLHLDDFGLRAPGGWQMDLGTDGPRLVAAVQASWVGDAEIDSLNRLVVRARLGWHDVAVLRAYRRYRRHAGSAWTDQQLDDPLVAFPEVARALLAYFAARFDPDPRRAGESPDVARQAVLDAVAAVEGLEQDQVLRGYLGLVDATVRTSHWVGDGPVARRPTLCLKFDSAAVPELPAPRPRLEAFVYSPRIEGLHLRGGLIARGGIRWSERRDDLRTEVLGLVHAQVLKNAIIVPTGAKGGFVCRRLGASMSPEQTAEEVRACYELFISGLLDITDNVVGGAVITPPRVRPADGEDPYLVVAADKGTAQLSDAANAISAGRRFWLGDAFASGGSHGYDHKAMGITARGVWVVVAQHFRQLGMDAATERVRVVGVGDMSGDVFGNGMVRSGAIRLVAAFDHRDIFIDPDPDPAASHEERQRLFALPRSSWQDYNRDLISTGGGVWSRSTKEIALSPEAQAALGISAPSLRPPEVVKAILSAPADLLWFGGIGTFVRGAGESDSEVGDPDDDRVRIDARSLRARVVAEGGNLACTPRARVQYARRGGRINADFIDNAAGVATSDREVNLKILLALAIERGLLAAPERDTVLVGVREQVAHEVLRQVGLSAVAITDAVPTSAVDLDSFEALMVALEADGGLDRQVDALPDAEELTVRRDAGAGLTRPELAVLLAHAKSNLTTILARSPLMRDPEILEAVEATFPPSVTERFGGLITEHRLYAELAGTAVGSEIVDRMGITWAHETADQLGVQFADAAAAYWTARQVLGADRRWRQLEAIAAGLPTDTELVLHQAIASAVDVLARTYLERRDVQLERFVGEDQPVVAEIATARRSAPPRHDDLDAADLVEGGIAPEQADQWAGLATLGLAADVGQASRSLDRPVSEVLEAFAATDDALGLPRLEDSLRAVHPAGRWERWELRAQLDDLRRLRREVATAALAAAPGKPPGEAVDAWIADRGPRLARFHRLATEIDLPGGDALCLGSLAARALSDVVADG